METQAAIAGRRSIRRFHDKPVPRELIERVLEAAVQAPSGKNSQPWRFVVVTEKKRAAMLEVLRAGIRKCAAQGIPLGSSENTAAIMEQAPATIFVFNAASLHYQPGAEWQGVVDTQSIGAAIENLLLSAHDQGLGTLWICDVFYAYEELRAWLGREEQLIAAISLGYPAEAPSARPRKSAAEITCWLED